MFDYDEGSLIMSSLSLTAKAIRRGFLTIAATTVATGSVFSGSVIAEEAQAEKVERIAVTGSRIKRTDMETASPVSSDRRFSDYRFWRYIYR